MKNPSCKKANTYIRSDSRDLCTIFIKVKLLNELTHKIFTLLEPSLVKYCQIGNLTGNKLIFITANGSIATQLRFQSVDLLKKFSQDASLKQIQQIECKVRPATTTLPTRLEAHPPKNMPPLSLTTAEMMHNIAESIDHSTLREVMKRIAMRTRQKRGMQAKE
ncbi:MAG: DUF721 domain-containing protein [Gammaproteobacteria bacterium]|nr:DUF721 domain-containing protein [Gammaproteobacteria bacterium]MCW5582693.1 DUF721 domain-containing protein [Gammaproteobacteria bacterium]